MKAESKKYLAENLYLWDSAKLGVNKHLSNNQADALAAIAKEIKPDILWQLRECQDCHDALVKFVYTAYDRELKREAKKINIP